MNQPKIGDNVTSEQISGALNVASFPGETPDPAKKWHQGSNSGGLFQPWSKDFGYPEGYPLYGGTVNKSGEKHHIYWLPSRKATCILKLMEEPKNYKIEPNA